MKKILFLAVIFASCTAEKSPKNKLKQKKDIPTVVEVKNKADSVKTAISIDSIEKLIKNFPTLIGFKPSKTCSSLSIKGDFYGDGVEDIAVQIQNDNKNEIVIFNFGKSLNAHILGSGVDKIDSHHLTYTEVFEPIKPGEILWSNYDTDFIRLEDVPEKKKIRLKHHAIFLHLADKCGGAIIYFQNGAFHSLFYM